MRKLLLSLILVFCAAALSAQNKLWLSAEYKTVFPLVVFQYDLSPDASAADSVYRGKSLGLLLNWEIKKPIKSGLAMCRRAFWGQVV